MKGIDIEVNVMIMGKKCGRTVFVMKDSICKGRKMEKV